MENKKARHGNDGHYNNHAPDYTKTTDTINNFRDAMLQDGIAIKGPIIADGQIHRFASGSKGNKNGWYVFHGEWGAAGIWGKVDTVNWSENNTRKLLPLEQKQLQEQIAKAKAARNKEIKEKQEVAAQKAVNDWNKLSETGTSPYLERKMVKGYGIRYGKAGVAIPLQDINGKLWNYQIIYHDGKKMFQRGGKKKGYFHVIGDLSASKEIYICEGYATGASIYEATGVTTIIAFDAGNLEPVIAAIKSKYPSIAITIAADNDQWGEVNTGKIKAEEAAVKHNCTVILPEFSDTIKNRGSNHNITEPTDFNDLHIMAGLDEVKRQLDPNNHWPHPQPIKQKIAEAYPLPESIIPEALRPWVVDIAHRMQCPIDYVASTAIVMMASLIGSGCGIRPKQDDDWLVIPNLWGCNIGSPSVMKSPSMNEALKPLSRLEAIGKENHDRDKKRHEADMLAYNASHKVISSEIENAARGRKDADMELAKQKFMQLQEPQEPVWQRYKTNDATIEMVSVLLSQNTRGILVVRDEIMGLLNSWEREDKSVDRAYYLEAWNGYGSYTTDRIGRGTIHTENMCVSLFGNTQPDKILRYLLKAIKGDNDGLLQRLQILIYPEENNSHWKLVDEKPDTVSRDKVYELAEKISRIDFTSLGALFDEYKKIPYFHFSTEAQKIFYQWLTALEKEKIRNTDSDDIIVEHLSKYRSLMPSLALVFHLIDLIDGRSEGGVSEDAALKAAAWCDYLESHMRRVYSLVQNVSLKAAALLATKIKTGKLPEKFTVRDIYRKQWASLTDVDVVKSACDELVDAGWVQEILTPAAFQQKEKIEYLINPKARGKL